METALAAGITALVEPGYLTLEQLLDKMAKTPAKLLGLPAGTLEKGAPADVILIDPQEKWVVDPARLHGKSRNCVFKGRELIGKVKFTVCGGRIVWNELD